MRLVDPYTASRFSSHSASLCTCWRITRPDGGELGFTDHDQDISFTGTLFRAAGGAVGSAIEATADLAPDNADIVGVFDAASFSAADVDAGRFDDARIDVWRVDWADPAARLLIKSGTLGNIDRTGEGYTAEFRSLKHYLDQVAGRIYGRTCDADLGAPRCGVDLTDPAFAGTATVAAGGEREVTVTGADSFASGWFSLGRITVLDGPLAGVSGLIRRHEKAGPIVTIALWAGMGQPLSPGTGLKLAAGCDKRFATCGEKFANRLNFQGFPHIPGTDVLTAYPSRGEVHDGRRR